MPATGRVPLAVKPCDLTGQQREQRQYAVIVMLVRIMAMIDESMVAFIVPEMWDWIVERES